MNYDKIFKIMDSLEVHVISECSQKMTINSYFTTHSKQLNFDYEFEDSLSTLRVEIRVPAADIQVTIVTDNEEELMKRIINFIPDEFSTDDLPMYLEKFKKQEEL